VRKRRRKRKKIDFLKKGFFIFLYNSNSSSSTSNSNVTDSSTTSATNTIPTSQPISQKVNEIPVEAAAVKAPPDHIKRNKKAKNQRMSESEARKILCKHNYFQN